MTQPYNRLTTKDPVTVGTTATALLSTSDVSLSGLRGVVLSPDGDIYIGDATVTTTNGIPVYAGQTLDLTHYAGQVYAVAASSTTCRVMLGAN